MKVEFIRKDFGSVSADLLVVPCFKAKIPAWVHAELVKAGVGKDFIGEKGRYYLLPVKGKPYKRLMLIGLGKEKNVGLDDFRLAAAKAIRGAKGPRLANVAFLLDFNGATRHSEKDVAAAMVEGALLSDLKLEPYKKKKEGGRKIEKLLLVSKMDLASMVEEGRILAESQNYARLVAVEPANIMTPRKLAGVARELAKAYGFGFRVMGRSELEKKGMAGILAVSRGSVQEPVLVELKFNDGKKLPHVVLVGKGITFDSGGISIKPSKGMEMMKFDKCGAVVVLGVMRAAAEMKFPLRITALLPATENMPGGSASKPGDIIRMYNGKTVEIVNTDAEGRMILGDALAYANEAKPELIIDAATLTGAMMVVLGKQGIGMLGTDHGAMKEMYDCGLETNERVWELPLWKEYSEMVKGDYADLKNVGSESGEAGTITAAAFLREFVGSTPWVHLDIASVEWNDGSSGYFCRGPSGKGVRLLATFLKKWSKNKKK
ncbi:MAG: leucyl aminopeptidase [Candidatus ainarchaeum sp.]|nr:leucyl aminopeptidase [Candidatus ainarchaeum sp.]MDD5096189.1 leucyl aminopeptidase [Candidatus ainarchaeum sp.]